MIVCHCKAVSDRTLKREIEGGAGCCRELGARTGAGTICGGCLPTLRELVEAAQIPPCSEHTTLAVLDLAIPARPSAR